MFHDFSFGRNLLRDEIWICFSAIQTSKEHEIDEGFFDVIEKGWLIKEGANDDSRRKRRVLYLCIWANYVILFHPIVDFFVVNKVYFLMLVVPRRTWKQMLENSFQIRTFVNTPIWFMWSDQGKRRLERIWCKNFEGKVMFWERPLTSYPWIQYSLPFKCGYGRNRQVNAKTY